MIGLGCRSETSEIIHGLGAIVCDESVFCSSGQRALVGLEEEESLAPEADWREGNAACEVRERVA